MKQILKKKPYTQSKHSTLKVQQKYMKNLAQELHKSNIAVQHINQYRKEEEESNKNIEEVKNELNSCISQIHNENKRQKILKQLISILKGQMTNIQAKQTEEKQKEQKELDKIIKQLRDDIDKINHKKNQQVANIAVLKQSANQCRSQRVVFSNLFKKIERELKQSEQTYKNQLLRSEKNKMQLQASASKKNRLIRTADIHENSESQLFDLFHEVPNMKSKRNLISSNSKKQSEFKYTNSMNIRISKYQNTKCLQIQQNLSKRIITKGGRLNSSKQNIENYSTVTQQLTKFSQRIKLAIGCSTFKQIEELANTIVDQNCHLQEQIREINENIQKKQKDITSMAFKQRQMKIVSNQSFQYSLPDNNNFQSSSKPRNSLERQCILTQSRVQILNNKSNKMLKNSKKFQLSQHKTEDQPISKMIGEEEVSDLVQQFTELCSLLKIKIDSQNHGPDAYKNMLKISPIQIQQKFRVLDDEISRVWYKIQPNPNNQGPFLTATSHVFSQWPENCQQIQAQKANKTKNDESRVRVKAGGQFIRRQSNGQLNSILNRMDRFGQCEKYLDREGFCGQYRKQLSRKAKKRQKK